ncbi:hypothetical protein [Nocardioides limicola]|uniref:hypothetical protein n=1 Tax=Nocardioides limicola TaxID=2803368 RepID=UPI00193B187F|nr:hypothetical protein [Nocardioides sp. DJM-14]
MPEIDDGAMLAELRAMWERTDPMPAHLPDRIIAAIAAEDLDVELLTLTASESLAVRGGASQVLECETDDLTMVVRLSEAPDGSRRVDGWTEGVQEVQLLTSAGTRSTEVSRAGRFEFTQVPAGPVRLRLRGDHRGFVTTEFEV